MKAFAPNGKQIVGVLESVLGVARIADESFTNGKKEIAFEYDGETEIDWNSQKSVLSGKLKLFVDESGEVWPEKKIRLE